MAGWVSMGPLARKNSEHRDPTKLGSKSYYATHAHVAGKTGERDRAGRPVCVHGRRGLGKKELLHSSLLSAFFLSPCVDGRPVGSCRRQQPGGGGPACRGEERQRRCACVRAAVQRTEGRSRGEAAGCCSCIALMVFVSDLRLDSDNLFGCYWFY